MKNSAIQWIFITALILVTVALFSALNFNFSWVFFLVVFGQVIFVVMVFKILNDNYTTDKTFEDFYQDRSDLSE
jgi:hypothetical protein